MSQTTEDYDLTAAAAEHRAASQKEIRARQGTGKRAEDAAGARLDDRLRVEDRIRAAGFPKLADALTSEHHAADRVVALLTGRPARSARNVDIDVAMDDHQQARRRVADYLAAETGETP